MGKKALKSSPSYLKPMAKVKKPQTLSMTMAPAEASLVCCTRMSPLDSVSMSSGCSQSPEVRATPYLVDTQINQRPIVGQVGKSIEECNAHDDTHQRKGSAGCERRGFTIVAERRSFCFLLGRRLGDFATSSMGRASSREQTRMRDRTRIFVTGYLWLSGK